MDGNAILAAIGVGVAAVMAVVEGLRRILPQLQAIQKELRANTAETKGAKKAAEKAAEEMNWHQRATALSLENDDLRRRIALLEGVPECLACRTKIAAMLRSAPVLRRHSDPPVPPPAEPQP